MGLVSAVKTLELWPVKMAKPSTGKVYFAKQNVKSSDDAYQ